MKTIFITLDGAKHRIKSIVHDNFIDQLNSGNKFINLIKRKRYCIINTEKIIEINELPQNYENNDQQQNSGRD